MRRCLLFLIVDVVSLYSTTAVVHDWLKLLLSFFGSPFSRLTRHVAVTSGCRFAHIATDSKGYIGSLNILKVRLDLSQS